MLIYSFGSRTVIYRLCHVFVKKGTILLNTDSNEIGL